ncbi:MULTISPECIES: SGNH/GDSL hydrolase family protein [Arthrobacter]|uniref:SGNH/GDSL hydrolase family protein n=2 Tax=Arthrobacter TaxID=1663 RepID=A0ABU9KMF2_9MICC|nr:SGNH/GDSL hydrolase family protein [Arthrobacter sp. YJM1]MDP5227523.1 SGNH/GDSL hydrolase family protein [Arthrobacter sp. YJM1]
MNAEFRSRLRRWMRVSALLVMTPAVLTGFLVQPAEAAASTTTYAALGDSYTAGQGAPPYQDTVCYRSPQYSYPADVSMLRGISFKGNAACSGASTADIPAELATLPAGGVKLVTVTVGGIDAGSNQVATDCPNGTLTTECQALLTIDPTEAAALKAKLATAYAQIKTQFPTATVVAMGYPRMFTGLYLLSPFANALNSSINTLDGSISAQAAASGVRFVDVRQAFSGHEIGSFSGQWINYNSSNTADPANFHPNATGYRSGYYQSLVNAGLLPRK